MKVSVEIGFTVRMGDPAAHEYARFRIAIDEIPIDLPHEEQALAMLKARSAIGDAFAELDELAIERMRELGLVTE